jgi:hypothetical protein
MKLADNVLIMIDEMVGESCPDCDSTKIKKTNSANICEACEYEWSSPLEFKEGKTRTHSFLTDRGWNYDAEVRSYKHPDYPGHELVNWKDKIHHLKDGEPVSSIPHKVENEKQFRSVSNYVRRTFGKKKGRPKVAKVDGE